MRIEIRISGAKENKSKADENSVFESMGRNFHRRVRQERSRKSVVFIVNWLISVAAAATSAALFIAENTVGFGENKALYISSLVTSVSVAVVSLVTGAINFLNDSKEYKRAKEQYKDLVEKLKDCSVLKKRGMYQEATACIRNYRAMYSTALKYSDELDICAQYELADCLHLQSDFEGAQANCEAVANNKNSSDEYRNKALELNAHCLKHIGEFDAAREKYRNLPKNAMAAVKKWDRLISIDILRIYSAYLENIAKGGADEEFYDWLCGVVEEIESECLKNASEEYITRYSPVVQKYKEFFSGKLSSAYANAASGNYKTCYLPIIEKYEKLIEEKQSSNMLIANLESQINVFRDRLAESGNEDDKRLRLIYNSIFIRAELKRTALTDQYTDDELRSVTKDYMLCYDASLLEHDYNMYSQVCVAISLLPKNVSGHTIDLTEVKKECGRRNMKFNMKLCSYVLDINSGAPNAQALKTAMSELPMIIL